MRDIYKHTNGDQEFSKRELRKLSQYLHVANISKSIWSENYFVIFELFS